MSDRRLVKFQVWNRETKEMFETNDYQHLEFHEKARWFLKTWDGKLICNFMNGELRQFTGLYDKNKNEVLEGDIIVNKKGKGERYPYVVVWKKEWAKFVLYLIPLFPQKERLIYASIQKCSNWEKVGNIYQNPELVQPL